VLKENFYGLNSSPDVCAS